MADLLTAALDLAGNGWAVFPCKWAGKDAKAPLTLHGHHEASSDPEQIRAWWSRWPDAMIGAPVPATLLVLDIDPRNGGSVEKLEQIAGTVPDTLTAWSGRGDGGRHLFYLRPAGQLTHTRLRGTGIDLKVNGYTIVPPSIHPAAGRPYRWDQRPAVRLPHRLRELLRPAPPPPRVRLLQPGDGSTLVAWLARQTSNANDSLYWAARRAAERGILTPALEADLVAAAGTAAAGGGKLGEGGGERQSWRTVQSARQAVGGIR